MGTILQMGRRRRNREFVSGLFKEYEKELTAFLARMLPTAADAADIAQESYLKLYRNYASEEVRHPRALLFKTATNLAMDFLTKSRRIPKYVINTEELNHLPATKPSPEVMAMHEQALHLLSEAIKELPPRRRQVIVMHKMMQMTYPEIADELGISRSMVEQHMTRALAYCRGRLIDLDNLI